MLDPVQFAGVHGPARHGSWIYQRPFFPGACAEPRARLLVQYAEQQEGDHHDKPRLYNPHIPVDFKVA